MSTPWTGRRWGASALRAASLVLAFVVFGQATDAEAPPVVAAPTHPIAQELRRQAPLWYDGERDTWRRVDLPVEKPAKPSPASTGGGGGNLGGLEALSLSLFGWMMIALVAAAVAAVVVVIVRTRADGAALDLAPAGTRPTPARLSELPLELPHHDDPEAGLRASIAASDWRAAVVWLYALMLLDLDRAGLLRLHKGKTNRTYCDELRAAVVAGGLAADAPGDLAVTAAAFEQCYFGHHPADRAVVDDLSRRRARLVAAGATSAAP